MAWFGSPRPPSTPRPGSYWENIRTRFPGIQASLTRGAPSGIQLPWMGQQPGGVAGYTRPGTIQQPPPSQIPRKIGSDLPLRGPTGGFTQTGPWRGGAAGYTNAGAIRQPTNVVGGFTRPGTIRKG